MPTATTLLAAVDVAERHAGDQCKSFAVFQDTPTRFIICPLENVPYYMDILHYANPRQYPAPADRCSAEYQWAMQVSYPDPNYKNERD